MTVAVDVLVDLLALAALGVQLLVGAVEGVVPTKTPPPAVIEIEMALEPPPPPAVEQ